MKLDLANYFQTSIFMSGTPAEYQTVISKTEFRCDCPLYEAVLQKYVCRPVLNLIKCFDSQFNSAVVATYINEKNVLAKENSRKSLKFPSHILVNCSSINEVNSLYNNLFNYKLFRTDNVHFISIHSPKPVQDTNTKIESFIRPMVDGEDDLNKIIANHRIEIDRWLKKNFTAEERYDYEPKTMMDILELVDAGVIFNGEPVILFQVDMISEGINLSSFNAGVVKSKADVKAMQQIGRIIRNYTLSNGKTVREKKIEGHANIYSIIENEHDVSELLNRLEEFDLTNEAFDWGNKIDVSNGSSPDIDEDDNLPFDIVFQWEAITDVEVIEYRALFQNWNNNNEARHISSDIISKIPENVLADIATIYRYNPSSIRSAHSELKSVKKEQKKKNLDENEKKKLKKTENKKKISIQHLINNLRQDIIHNQIIANQPHGWTEWTKFKPDFIECYLAKGSTKLAKSITEILKILDPYLHLDENPNELTNK